MLSLVDNALLQGLTHAPAVLGVALAFRVMRYPDLTADGSFLIGSTVFAAAVHAGWSPGTSLTAALLCGGLAGLATAVLNARLGVTPILSGILTSMACYSLGFRVLGRRPNLGLLSHRSLFDSADSLDRTFAGWDVHPAALGLCGVIVAMLLWSIVLLLRSDMGLVLRAVGSNDSLTARLGRTPRRYRYVGLSLANALVAASGALVTTRQGFADVNVGTGIVVVLIACLVMGEEFFRVVHLDARRVLGARVLSPAVGAVLYFAMFLLVVRASSRGWLPVRLEPTDLTLVSALLIVSVHLSRLRTRRRDDDVLPL